jgi:hypothetical protein
VVLPLHQERIQKKVKTAFLVLPTRKHKKQIVMEKVKILKSVLTLFFSFWVMALFAQGDGSAGITEATNMVTSYFDPATRLIYAIGAIVGLIGGVKVYSKFSSGDPDTGKTAAAWFGACIFLIVAATILRSFFL